MLVRKSLIKINAFSNSVQLSLIFCQEEVFSVLVWVPCVWEVSHPSCSGSNLHGGQPRVASLLAFTSMAWAAHFYSAYTTLFWDCLLWEEALISCFHIGVNLYHTQMLIPSADSQLLHHMMQEETRSGGTFSRWGKGEDNWLVPKSTGLSSCSWSTLWCIFCFPLCTKWCRLSGPLFLLPGVGRTEHSKLSHSHIAHTKETKQFVSGLVFHTLLH